MARKINQIRTVEQRRRRESKTNYKTRLGLLKSGKTRLVVRLSLNAVYAQIIKYEEKGDKVLAQASSKDLAKLGWNYGPNTSTSYLVGLLVAKNAQKANITESIMDVGIKSTMPASKIYAVLKGAIDAGLVVPCDEKVLPKQDRLTGKHIADYAKKLKAEDSKKYEREFSKYIKQKIDPTKIESDFNACKAKITGTK